MVTSNDCYKRYGPAAAEIYMTVWTVPENLRIATVPKRIYCNKEMIAPLSAAFKNIIDRNLQDQLKTWDGCFNIRKKRGGRSTSLHAWGIAIDINAAWNGLGQTPTISKELVDCFLFAGFEWGGYWSRKDGMHFQLAKL